MDSGDVEIVKKIKIYLFTSLDLNFTSDKKFSLNNFPKTKELLFSQTPKTQLTSLLANRSEKAPI